MKLRTIPGPLAFALLLVVFAGAGCAKRSRVAAAPPAAPPVAAETRETQPPAPSPPPAPDPAATARELLPIFFAYDSHALDEAARATLDQNARKLRDQADLRIVIEGHCDERGTVEYNQALGERRARAVRDYLSWAGVPAARLTVVSYGKERPFEEGHTEAAWAANRRAHFVVP